MNRIPSEEIRHEEKPEPNWLAGFGQNRAFAGLGWNFTPAIRTELGYMNQYIDDARHVNTTMHHLIMGSLFINF